jgi:hypothetical protein
MVKLRIITPIQEEQEIEEQEIEEKEDVHELKIRRYLEKSARQSKLRIIQKTPERFYLVTTRFNNKTWSENQAFRQQNNSKYACIYSSEAIISAYIPQEAYLFVLEMNNDKNQIEGIGLIKNSPLLKRFPIYEDNKYNRFHYGSKYWIGRDQVINETNQIKNALYINCWKLLEQRCFKGPAHLKRGRNITAFPLDTAHFMDGETPILIIDILRQLFKTFIQG